MNTSTALGIDPRFENDAFTPSGVLPTFGFVRLPTILELIPVGRSTIFEMMKRGEFPRPVRLSSRISAWQVQDVRDYIRRQGPS